jgi:tetratricopeptide (TPR) repeat protein
MSVPIMVLGLSLAAAAPASSRTARVWEAPLAMPTYELGPADPTPPLAEWQKRGGRPIYPYPRLDDLTKRRVQRTYRAVFLENEYLKVTVLPEMGGKVWAIYDKTAGRDVLYTNHVVKYGMIALRGAWVSGGIEWNFPDGHTVSTVSPVDYATREEPDGSATVTVGEIERVQRMQWAVTLRLRPGRKDLESVVTLYNRNELPGRYWFWATAAAPATDDLRFVYPMREAYPHAFWPVYSFPEEQGVDLGTYREVPDYLSLFARNSARDFFGVYYERSDRGVVHVADHREMTGKKTWTWGTGDRGAIWIEKLTDADGQYVEFQAGRFETQMEHEFLAPHRLERFVEHWYPVDRLGGAWDEATPDAALRIGVEAGRARIALSANAVFEDAQMRVEAGGELVRSLRATLRPEAPFTAEIDLPAGTAGRPVAVIVTNREGRELLRYRTDLPVDGNPDFRPATRPAPDPLVGTSAEQAYVEGVAADKRSDEGSARGAYEEALRRDPGFAPAHVALGVSFYRSGEYDRAAEHLDAALLRNVDAAEARYTLGLVRRAQGREREAVEHLTWAVRNGFREPTARYVLGEIALSGGRFEEARAQLSQAALLDPRDLEVRTALAVAERLAGRREEARARIEGVLAEVPIDPLALYERYVLSQAPQDLEEVARLMSREPDTALDLAFGYLALGRADEARRVLDAATARAPGQPMLHYVLGSVLARAGDVAGSRAQYQLGAQGDPAFVFPSRPEEIRVLEAVRADLPSDGRAAGFLGDALASRGRLQEALAAWRDAARLDPGNAIARRNLAWALWLVAGQPAEALAEYDQAIALLPQQDRLYVERDRVLTARGDTARRIVSLESAPLAVRSRSEVAQALASAYVAAGRYEEALAILAKTSFVAGEGEASVLLVERKARIGLARKLLAGKRYEQAAEQFLKATEYPRNLDVGRPPMESHAREYVSAARALEAAGQRERAAALWRRAAEEPLKSPTQPEEPWSEHYFFKAVALDHEGRPDEARALYGRLAGLADDAHVRDAEPAPPRGVLRFVLAGLGLRALGRPGEAETAFRRAIDIDPANERVHEELLRSDREATPSRP